MYMPIAAITMGLGLLVVRYFKVTPPIAYAIGLVVSIIYDIIVYKVLKADPRQ